MEPYTVVKTFTATMRKDRENLGERITAWLSQHEDVRVVDKKIKLSSGRQYHCLTVSLFCAQADARKTLGAGSEA